MARGSRVPYSCARHTQVLQSCSPNTSLALSRQLHRGLGRADRLEPVDVPQADAICGRKTAPSRSRRGGGRVDFSAVAVGHTL